MCVMGLASYHACVLATVYAHSEPLVCASKIMMQVEAVTATINGIIAAAHVRVVTVHHVSAAHRSVEVYHRPIRLFLQ
jgi:hypothetical protein